LVLFRPEGPVTKAVGQGEAVQPTRALEALARAGSGRQADHGKTGIQMRDSKTERSPMGARICMGG